MGDWDDEIFEIPDLQISYFSDQNEDYIPSNSNLDDEEEYEVPSTVDSSRVHDNNVTIPLYPDCEGEEESGVTRINDFCARVHYDEESIPLYRDLNDVEVVAVSGMNGGVAAVKSSRFQRGPCSFFLMGNCRRSNCKFFHSTRLSEDFTERERTQKRPLCTYFFMGRCKFGDKCKFSHDEEDGTQTSSITKDGIDCGICYEKINKSFGILTCNCAFCLSCIRKWRNDGQQIQNKETVRLCPLCRTESLFVIPSPIFVTDKKMKDMLLESYKLKCSQIPCKYFSPTDVFPSCPFGKSCFYAHLNEDGTPALTKPRTHTYKGSRKNDNRFGRRTNEYTQQIYTSIDFDDFDELLISLLSSGSFDDNFIHSLIVDDDDDNDDL